MDKKIIFIIFVVLFITGCNIRTGPTDKTDGELIRPIEVQIHKGTKGLDLEFVKGQPPTNVWEGEAFPITLQLKNKGAYAIQRGLLAITGNLYFGVDIDVQFELEGKSEFNPEGEFSFEKFSATAGFVDDDKTDSFFVIACYEYKTFASATLCINPRVMEIDNEIPRGECRVGTVSVSGGQGAPIAVTKIEEEILPMGQDALRLNLKIAVSNRGGGKVVNVGAYDKDCRGIALAAEEIGLVQVDEIRFSNYRLGSEQFPIKCPNLKDNSFTLDSSGQFTIECYADMDPEIIGSVAFTTPLLTELSYGYTQLSGSKSITIKNTLQ